ncbi:MAG TPA: Ig-like domain-containing protein, partial [Candidatus Limnocylindrales bacterium]|nr:Ig-like domain-containing protein [Candidatus Limnocylindrales bacterium]
MRPIRTVRAARSAPFESLGTLLSSHRAVTRVAAAALSFTLIIAFSQQTATTQAGPEPAPLVPESLLPQSIGVGIVTDAGVTVSFETPMDPESVESSLQVLPAAKVTLTWNDDHTELTVAPQRLWRTDERYLIVVPASAEREDGEPLRAAQRFAFSTQTAPTVSEFQVRLVSADLEVDAPATPVAQELATDGISTVPAPGSHAPTSTATEVSATSAIRVGFTAAMDRPDTEAHFSINPTVEGDVAWEGNTLVFRPSERLEAGSRYTISVIGAHDLTGNVLGGKANFSFIVQEGAQLTRTTPDTDATDVEPESVEMWFSAPMDIEATNEAFALTDTSTGALVGGLLDWNEAATQLVYRPDVAFAGGRTFEVKLDGARDADGNEVDLTWSFSTTAP